MKQEELKVALCGYLPWGVYVNDTVQNLLLEGVFESNGENRVRLLMSKKKGSSTFYTPRIETVKPILYNINCLTKPIIVKGYNGGEPFVPIEFFYVTDDNDTCPIEQDYGNIQLIKTLKEIAHFENHFDTQFLPNWVIQMFDRWKIDYRNLIGQGLAVDVETLKENCYE